MRRPFKPQIVEIGECLVCDCKQGINGANLSIKNCLMKFSAFDWLHHNETQIKKKKKIQMLRTYSGREDVREEVVYRDVPA